jgi:uncharacterized protein with NAD-binding domain and iron-sulfur cluster
MTAALRLAERGYAVTLFEEKAMLGGNLASRALPHGGALDVYPHMFQGWYENFWTLMDDSEVKQKESFSSFDSAHQLRRDEFPEFSTLTRPYSPRYVLQNLASGIARPLDMFVFGCANLDLLAERAEPTVRLKNMSLTGYLNTRPYMTNAAIKAFETYVSVVWAIPAYQISAADCRTYSTYCYAAPEDDAWLTSGPAAEAFIDKLAAALTKAGVRIVLNTRIEEVKLKGERVRSIVLQRTRLDPRTYAWVKTGAPRAEEVEDLLLAVPSDALADLVRRGVRGERAVDAAPRLAELVRLNPQKIPMLNLALKRKLDEIPPDPVGLSGSKLNLAFTDISQRWTRSPEFGERTVLAVSCSESALLGGPHPTDDAHQIMKELAEYLPFHPGTEWGESPDVDWRLTSYHENDDAKLTVNAIGTDQWRPKPECEGVGNLFLAGDFCENHFGITTVEAAVATGLQAAAAIVRRRELGPPVEIKKPKTIGGEEYVALRLAWLPAAYAARILSKVDHRIDPTRSADVGEESLLHYMLTPGLPPRYRRPDG